MKNRLSDPHFFPDPAKNLHADPDPDPGGKGKKMICFTFFGSELPKTDD